MSLMRFRWLFLVLLCFLRGVFFVCFRLYNRDNGSLLRDGVLLVGFLFGSLSLDWLVESGNQVFIVVVVEILFIGHLLQIVFQTCG